MTNTIADYNLSLVALSYAVALGGALVGMFTSQYVRDEHGALRLPWLLLSALILSGCMMWSSHFIGMLAYQPGVPMTFGIRLTFLPFLISVIFTGAAIVIVSGHPESSGVLIAGGATTAMGELGLHYGAMAALHVPARITQSVDFVGLSVILALAASIGALFMMVRLQHRGRYLSAPLLAAAVCGMHYTGMAAMSAPPSQQAVDYFSGTMTPDILGIVVLVAAGATAVLGIMAGVYGYLMEHTVTPGIKPAS